MSAERALVNFLLARIAEGQATALELRRFHGTPAIQEARERLLKVEVAHRKIIKAAEEYEPELDQGDNGSAAYSLILRTLALPYADHPDYDEGWRA